MSGVFFFVGVYVREEEKGMEGGGKLISLKADLQTAEGSDSREGETDVYFRLPLPLP